MFLLDWDCNHIWDIFLIFFTCFSSSLSYPFYHYYYPTVRLIITPGLVLYVCLQCLILWIISNIGKKMIFLTKFQFWLFYNISHYVIVLRRKIINENWMSIKIMLLAKTQQVVLQLVYVEVGSRLLVWGLNLCFIYYLHLASDS